MSLEYDSTRRSHCALTLHSGVHLTMKSLRQRMTYGDLLEGVPTASWNDRIVDYACAPSSWNPSAVPWLITPERRSWLREPGDMEGVTGVHRAPAEWLPQIQCSAHFESLGHLRNPDMDGSALTIVWFQEDYALPICPAVLHAIKSMDWSAHALEYQF